MSIAHRKRLFEEIGLSELLRITQRFFLRVFFGGLNQKLTDPNPDFPQ